MTPWACVSVAAMIMLVFLQQCSAWSACDDINVNFLIDTDSIINSADKVTHFISSVVNNGSSEAAAFSAVIYGDDIPVSQQIEIFTLRDTVSEARRSRATTRMLSRLERAFSGILAPRPKVRTKSVSLLSAFDVANGQDRPRPGPDHNARSQRKRERLGAGQNKKKNKNNDDSSHSTPGGGYRVGLRDDSDIYFVFDYYNELVDTEDDIAPRPPLPTYPNGTDSNQTEDVGDGEDPRVFGRGDPEHYASGDEHKQPPRDFSAVCALLFQIESGGVHFLLGQDYNRLFVECNGEYPDNKINHETFFHFGDNLLYESNADTSLINMETIYNLTCPAVIEIDELNGGLNLGNHDQWLDLSTVVQCNLVQIEHDDNAAPLELDTGESYIIVHDFFDDDNTFKLYDYLLSTPGIQSELEEIGCWAGVYRVISSDVVETTDTHDVLRLGVDVSHTPLEYILNANMNAEDHPVEGVRRQLLSNVKLTSGLHTIPLLDETFTGGKTYTKEASEEFSVGSRPKFTFTGTGSMTLTAMASININVALTFNFVWDVMAQYTYIYFVITVDWGLTAELSAEFVGQVTAKMKELARQSRYLTFSVGPVPVVMRFFATINANLETVPLRIKTGVSCHYGQTLKLGYHYLSNSRFHPEYGVLAVGHRYNFGYLAFWTASSFADCASLNYDHGAGLGLTCVWFDYNHRTRACRCYTGTLHPPIMNSLVADTYTTAYVMNRECGSWYYRRCDGCSLDFGMRNEGNAFSCYGLYCYRFPFPYSCWSTCYCFLGWHSWYCLSCPILQSNSGWREYFAPVEYSINSFEDHSNNGCEPMLEICSSQENENDCPVTEFGFDMMVDVTLGCNLYSSVTVYGRAELGVPFRITLPELDTSVCSLSSCDSTLQASFTIAMDLNFYFGAAIDFGDIDTLFDTLINGDSAMDIAEELSDFAAVEVLLATVQILPETALACMTLEGALSVLDSYYKGMSCCEPPPSAASAVEVHDMYGALPALPELGNRGGNGDDPHPGLGFNKLHEPNDWPGDDFEDQDHDHNLPIRQPDMVPYVVVVVVVVLLVAGVVLAFCNIVYFLCKRYKNDEHRFQKIDCTDTDTDDAQL